MSLTLYLDCCALQRPFDDRFQMRIALESEAVLQVLERVQLGSLKLVKSTALQLEIDHMPHGERRNFCEVLLEQITENLEMNDEIAQLARGYTSKGIKSLDALHLAYAVGYEINFFCTCDDRFLKKTTEIETGLTKVFNVVDLIQNIKL
jgi:predicted nucleic acid-binding protein